MTTKRRRTRRSLRVKKAIERPLYDGLRQWNRWMKSVWMKEISDHLNTRYATVKSVWD